MALQTAAPSLVPVLAADHAGGDEFGVAGRADVVVAGVALVAVEAGLAGLNGILADVAICAEGEGLVLARGCKEVRGLMKALQQAGGGDWGEYGGVDVLLVPCPRVFLGFLEGRGVGDREEGVRATFSRADASVAVAPFAFVTVITLPKAVVGEGGADRAECARVEACCRVLRR